VPLLGPDAAPLDLRFPGRTAVPGARRDHHVRHVGAAGDRRNEVLRAVAARHADHIGAAGDRVLGELHQVITPTTGS
jgi:hypothetical protein